jgi:NADPH-dependent ferric siderophore reductase
MSLPPYRLFRVNTERVELVTPHMKRITIDGSCLPAFRAGLPAQWLKVFVPTGDKQNVPGRAYTVRRFDPVSKKLDLDFLLHGDNGPVSAWAARVKPGESFEISAAHPRSGFALPSAMERCLLFGDDTALPAIAGILEALPAHTPADVFLEVDDAVDEQTIDTAAAANLTWLHRKRGGQAVARGLEEAANAIERPDENTIVWIAAEASIVKSLRAHALLQWGVDRRRLHVAGYWKRGVSNHKDEEAFN